jgi:hypothetical protein
MNKIFVILFLVFQFASCAAFDGISDVSISLNLPDEIVVVNYARVSTIRSMDGEIIRAGTSVYQFHFDVAIPANNHETIKVEDFIIQDGDTVSLTDVKFSWDM